MTANWNLTATKNTFARTKEYPSTRVGWTVWRPLAWCPIRPCIQYTAGAATMAGACSYTGQCGRCVVYTDPRRGMGNMRNCGMRKVKCGMECAARRWLAVTSHHMTRVIPHFSARRASTAWRENAYWACGKSLFTARRGCASAVLGVIILSVRLSVCLSVRLSRVLCD